MRLSTLFMTAVLAASSGTAFASGSAVSESWGDSAGLKVRTFPPQFLLPFYRGNIVFGVVENKSHDTVVGPVRVVLRNGHRFAKNADGYTPSGDAVFIINPSLDGELAPGDRSHPFVVKFSNPRGKNPPVGGFFEAENAFVLNLLHTADNDGNTGLESVAEFSGIIEVLADQFPNNTARLASGDLTIPGPSAFAQADAALAPFLGVPGQSRGDIQFHNLMGFQASCVGNHEIDTGTIGFFDFTAVDGSYGGADFPFLSANIDFASEPNLSPLLVADGQDASTIPNSYAKSAVITVDGETIGLVGVATPTLPVITNIDAQFVTPAVDDPDLLAAEVQPAIDALVNQGVDKIIALMHLQTLNAERALAVRLVGVDIIVGGGSNTLLADSNDRIRAGDSRQGDYPELFTNPNGKPVALVNTDGDFRYVGRLVSAFDADGLILPGLLDEVLSGSFAADAQGVTDLGAVANPDVVDLKNAIEGVLIAQEGNIFGNASVFLEGRRFETVDGFQTGVRIAETNLGNLTADANLTYAQGFESNVVVSFKNGGGIRSEIGRIEFPPGSTNPEDVLLLPNAPIAAAGKLEGDISQADISRVLAFNNALSLLTLTNDELKAVLEHAIENVPVGAVSNAGGRFPQVAGIRFSFDPALPAGTKVQSAVIEGPSGDIVIVENGVTVNPTDTYRVVTLNFLAGGGDGYPFPQGPAANRVDLPNGMFDGGATFAETGTEQDALAEYLLATTSAAFPFSEADTTVVDDNRIQNLEFRSDGVILP